MAKASGGGTRRSRAGAGARASGGTRSKARGSASGPSDEAPRREAPGREPPPVSPMQPGFAPECMMCPFGLLLFALRQSRPEAMEHLLKAGHELTLALKAVVDQAADRWEQAEQLQRIPVR